MRPFSQISLSLLHTPGSQLPCGQALSSRPLFNYANTEMPDTQITHTSWPDARGWLNRLDAQNCFPRAEGRDFESHTTTGRSGQNGRLLGIVCLFVVVLHPSNILRSYQDGCRFVTMHMHGGFIVLPHWDRCDLISDSVTLS